MKVSHIPCGPAANESERKALSHLESRLRSIPGNDRWILLTNLAFSVTHQRQSDEIDIVAIGPPGIRVIDVKHWNAEWVDSSTNSVEHEADKVSMKARKVGTTLRKSFSRLGQVDGAFLLTWDAAEVKELFGKRVRGVGFHSLSDWKRAIDFDSPRALSSSEVDRLATELYPKSAVALDGSIRRLANYINLEILSPKEQRFHRVYKGIHSTSQDAVNIHLYDLSAVEESTAETRARRESEALLMLQQYPWAPRIRDTFQPVPGYEGEMFYFTVIDPSAPTTAKRASDNSWETTARLVFARNAMRSLEEFHSTKAGEGHLVHRNLTPETILVRHDNTPILTGFESTKIPAEVSVAVPGHHLGAREGVISPEVCAHGIGAADQRSDIYSLCASLATLFGKGQDETGGKVLEILAEGRAEEPEARIALSDLELSLSRLLGESVPAPDVPPARFWAEEQEVSFGHHLYRIVTQLGSGGVGTAFKVEKVDPSTKEELGTYVAKVGHCDDSGSRVLGSYSRAHSHLGRHSALSVIYEVAKEWKENGFIALMSWIEGASLRDYRGVFSLLAEEFGVAGESLALQWLRTMCEALTVLHSNGLIHGDVSPGNMIVSESDLVLTDYDFVTRIGEEGTAPGTILYCPPPCQESQRASPSDDIYALAASFFHVLFDREPFQYGGELAKERGLNWEGLDLEEYSCLTYFLDRATSPDPVQRYKNGADALGALTGGPDSKENTKAVEFESISTNGAPTADGESSNRGTVERQDNEVEWLLFLLQSYPGSRWGNRETRGLDTEFASQTYVETQIEEALLRDIRERRAQLVILCGNAGDGKTALLQHLAVKLGLGQQRSSTRIIKGRTEDGLAVKMNLDGSAAWKDRSADDLLNEFLNPFLDGPPKNDVVHLLAVNDGRLVEWIDKYEETRLSRELHACLVGKRSHRDPHIRFINLNQRSLVGGIAAERRKIETDFLESLLDQLYGGDNAKEIWSPCLTCSAQERCEVFQATEVFGPEELGRGKPPEVRVHARRRLFEALQAVHLRGETHITVRELRAALVYILFGDHFCRDYHQGRGSPPYWERAFSPYSAGRQGEVLRALVRLDPALEAHPRIDRQLLRANVGVELDPARRRAHFEWPKESLGEFDNALDLAEGRHLHYFQTLPINADREELDELCARLCRGISYLEELPHQAYARPNVVPLRITPRTPTETAFWVEKPLSSFRLETDSPPETEGIEHLHREAFLIYRRRDGGEERLRMGVDLFHLLLELGDGYQMGDVSTDDTFAQLSIFVQRLVQEDDREVFAWNPMNDEAIYKIAAEKQMGEAGPMQQLTAHQISRGGDV